MGRRNTYNIQNDKILTQEVQKCTCLFDKSDKGHEEKTGKVCEIYIKLSQTPCFFLFLKTSSVHFLLCFCISSSKGQNIIFFNHTDIITSRSLVMHPCRQTQIYFAQELEFSILIYGLLKKNKTFILNAYLPCHSKNHSKHHS